MHTSKGNLFGLQTTREDASLIIIPVPWEATVSSPSGTSKTPENILKSSHKINLYDFQYPNIPEINIAMLNIPNEWAMLSDQLQSVVTGYVNSLASNSKSVYSNNSIAIQKINQYCLELKEDIKGKAIKYLEMGKMVALVGGDHSSPLGLIEALSLKHKNFGILQIDAHADLKEADHGFEYSHSSIMHNVLKIPQVTKVVQVGLREYTKKEAQIIHESKGRIVPFQDQKIQQQKYNGVTWNEICKNIIETLPEVIYITFDIDGLDSKLCPGTAFPSPGGLQFDEVIHLISALVKSGKTIIGFDICEIATSEHLGWDISIANRLLYKLATQMAISQKKLK